MKCIIYFNLETKIYAKKSDKNEKKKVNYINIPDQLLIRFQIVSYSFYQLVLAKNEEILKVDAKDSYLFLIDL